MRVVDLRLKNKEQNMIEGTISSMKMIESGEEKYIGVVLDTGYVVQISLEELDSIIDYANMSEELSEETQKEAEGSIEEDQQGHQRNDTAGDVLLAEKCSVCGSPIVWFSKDLGIKHCSNGKCRNSQVSLPTFDS